MSAYLYIHHLVTAVGITIMKLVKQIISLEISPIDHSLAITSNKNRHGELLPNTIRCIICGPSNCGKTNAMISLLLHENGVRFQNVYLYSKTSFQPKYLFLHNILKTIPEVNMFVLKNNEDLTSPNKVLPNSIFIFDDVLCENQVNIRNYFTMGRHKGIDCFYLSQTYSKIPKQLIRDNVNVLMVFKQDEINLKHIYNEHVNSDIPWQEFKILCLKIWKEPFMFLLINKDCELNKGRYRKAFDTFIKFD